MASGLITNIQRYSVHDGPGIRTTVFLKGCPLDCAWCHNPETISPRPEVLLAASRCIRCGACVAACPRHDPVGLPSGMAASFSGTLPAPTHAGQCLVCGACVEACPVNGRTMVGRAWSAAALVDVLQQDRLFFDESQGGVTFSGGEPLRQGTFLFAALALCRRAGIHTAVDTCGHASSDLVERLAEATDLILYDLKLLDEDQHVRYCGVSNRTILQNLDWLAHHHARLWLRIPLIPGVNNTPEQLAGMARLAASLPGIEQVHLLPYHKIGIHKRRSDNLGAAESFIPPSPEQIEQARTVFQTAGISVHVGG